MQRSLNIQTLRPAGNPNPFCTEKYKESILLKSNFGMGTALTADTVIQAGVGASAATGGTVTVGIYYIMVDDGNS